MIETLRFAVSSIASDLQLTSDSLAVASVDGHIRKYDLVTGTMLYDIEAHGFGLNCLRYDRCNTYLSSAADDGHIKIWSSDGLAVASLLGHSNYVQCLDIDPQNLLMLSGGQDKSVFLWDLRNLQDISVFSNVHREAVTGVHFAHDSSVFLTCSFDGTVHLWDTVSLNSIKTLSYKRATPISAARFSANSKYVLGLCLNSSLQLWDILDGHSNIMRTYTGLTAERYRLPLQVVNDRFYCGGEDGAIWSWLLEEETSPERVQVAKDSHVLNALHCSRDVLGVTSYCPDPPDESVVTVFRRTN